MKQLRKVLMLMIVLGAVMFSLTSCKEKPVDTPIEKPDVEVPDTPDKPVEPDTPVDPEIPDEPVEEIASEIILSEKSIVIELGKTYNISDLNITVSGNTDLQNTLTYTKYDEEIITIAEGVISAEKIGTTTIYVGVDDEKVEEEKITVRVKDLENFKTENRLCNK